MRDESERVTAWASKHKPDKRNNKTVVIILNARNPLEGLFIFNLLNLLKSYVMLSGVEA